MSAPDPHMAWAQQVAAENNAMAREAELTGAVNTLTRIVESLAAKLDRDMADLRAHVDDLDHSTVTRAAFYELHSRVDVLDEWREQRRRSA